MEVVFQAPAQEPEPKFDRFLKLLFFSCIMLPLLRILSIFATGMDSIGDNTKY